MKKKMLIKCAALALLFISMGGQAATLQEKYRDDNNDLICVYDSHGHDVYVNVGFSGHCSYNVPDSQLQNN